MDSVADLQFERTVDLAETGALELTRCFSRKFMIRRKQRKRNPVRECVVLTLALPCVPNPLGDQAAYPGRYAEEEQRRQAVEDGGR